MRQSLADERGGLLDALATLLLGAEDDGDEVMLDAYRGFRDPIEFDRFGRPAAFGAPEQDFLPV